MHAVLDGSVIRSPLSGVQLSVRHELVSLLKQGSGPPELDELRRELDRFEEECLALRERLGVVPGPRGFVRGWE